MIKKKNCFCLLASVLVLITCLTLINYQIQRILKLPFSNNLTHLDEAFVSPLSVIFFTSAIIWLCGSIYKCLTSPQFCNTQSEEDDFSEQAELVQLQFNRINLQQTYLNQKQANTQSTTQSKHEDLAFSNLPKIQIFKIVIPSFLELLCFFYGIVYLSFPKVMIFKIVSRLGLTTLYESLFTQDPKKIAKFFISVVTFAGFAIFNYSFVDSPNIEKDEKLYKTNILYGYMFTIAMCYLGLIKNIFQKQINETYGTCSGDGWILTQAKVNCVLAYLILLCLKEEIYGSVFTVLHLEFFLSVLGLTVLISVAFQLKAYILQNFMPVLGGFVGVLQKNLSLIASVIIFGQGINSGQICGVCLIALMALVYFLTGFSAEKQEASSKSNSKHPSENLQSPDKLFTKNGDIKNNDEKKLLKI